MVALEAYLTQSPSENLAGTDIQALSLDKPDWAWRIGRRIAYLRSLTPGWDGHGSRAVNPHVAIYVRNLIEGIAQFNTKEPQIVPTIFGGLQIEWHANGVDIEIEVSKPHSANLYIEYFGDDDIIEREMLWPDTDLDAALSLVSD